MNRGKGLSTTRAAKVALRQATPTPVSSPRNMAAKMAANPRGKTYTRFWPTRGRLRETLSPSTRSPLFIKVLARSRAATKIRSSKRLEKRRSVIRAS